MAQYTCCISYGRISYFDKEVEDHIKQSISSTKKITAYIHVLVAINFVSANQVINATLSTSAFTSTPGINYEKQTNLLTIHLVPYTLKTVKRNTSIE